eukprot:4566967-Pyramimonas_sp.AAC.1
MKHLAHAITSAPHRLASWTPRPLRWGNDIFQSDGDVSRIFQLWLSRPFASSKQFGDQSAH